MGKSFRSILNEHLEAATTAPAPQSAPFIPFDLPPESTFALRPVRTARPRTSDVYAEASAASRARAEIARRPRPEPVIDFARLSATDRADLAWFADLGATNLNEGLNARRLKTAYRKLARRLHPDLNPDGHELFLSLRARYARLLQTCNSR